MSSTPEATNPAPRGFPAKVIQKISFSDKLVVNRGSLDGVKIGNRFLVYAVSSEDILDPETGESLGRLEIVRGRGVVTHVQERMATLQPELVKSSRRVVRRRSPLLAFGDEEVIEPNEHRGDFDDPEVGDLVKPI